MAALIKIKNVLETKIAFVLAFLWLAFLGARELEPVVNPVITDFKVSKVLVQDEKIDISGTMTKHRDKSCSFVGVLAKGMTNNEEKVHVPLLFMDNKVDNTENRINGQQSYGPWRLTIAKDANLESVSLTSIHNCHWFWDTRTALVTIHINTLHLNEVQNKGGVNMLPIIAGIVSTLISNNLPKVAQAVVDKGLDYVQDKIGMELKPDMSPQELEEVRKAALQHEEFLISESNKNTADARDMQKEALKQDDVFSKRFVYYLSSFWSVISAVYIFFITFLEVPLSSVRYADTILGFLLGTIIASIINYFLGSSFGSDKKTELMSKEK